MFFHEQHQCIANLPFLFDKGRVDCPVVCAYFILQQLTMLHQPKKSLQLQVVRGFGEKSNFSAHLPGKASKGGKKKQQKNTENTQLCKKRCKLCNFKIVDPAWNCKLFTPYTFSMAKPFIGAKKCCKKKKDVKELEGHSACRLLQHWPVQRWLAKHQPNTSCTQLQTGTNALLFRWGTHEGNNDTTKKSKMELSLLETCPETRDPAAIGLGT